MSNPYESGTTVSDPRSFDGRTYVQIRRVGVLSCGKMSGAVAGIFGLLVGLIMAVFSFAALQVQGQGGNAPPPGFAVGVGLGTLIFAPVFYGVAGFVSGVMWAFLYNIVAGVAGGIEIETDAPM